MTDSPPKYAERYPIGPTRDHPHALRQTIEALQSSYEADGRGGYLAAGGWAGERLRELLFWLEGYVAGSGQ
jgi:hypothetical protein